MALIFQKTEKIDSALVYFNKALQASYVQKNRLWEGIVKGNIGSIYYNQKRYEEALPLLQKDVEISLGYKLYANAVLSLSDVILIHLAQKNYAEAQNSLLRCDTLLKKIEWIAVDIRAYAKFYETSAIYYETLQAYEQASRYRRLYEDADKAYRKYIKDIDIQRIKFRYNYELKQRDIEKLTEKAALQQTYLYIIGFALATVILMIIVLVQRFYQKNVLMARLRTQNEQIKQNNEQLLLNMEQITQQTQMIESQNQALYASNLSKDKIFSLISHDLRSPLARLKGIVGLLQDDLLSIVELQKILPALENNLDSTLNLTEELLYWAKSQIGGLQVHPTLLNPSLIVQQTIDYLQKTAEAKGILLSKGSLLDLPVVWADENMIKAVLRNLINNAIKFSNKNESIIITADYEPQDTVLFKISDTGIGIKPEIVETMFKNEPVRSTQGTAGEKGTGFGLTLCKDFVVQNGGQIWVKSTWRKGSEFCFTLPVVTAN
ncbi:MAG TPA: hypothetical protein DCM08_11810 [Microscillaceae bacterium]|jgi:signal transduction histidine kinase|nr:hypothetical protein [Microscillaceae bacterium]